MEPQQRPQRTLGTLYLDICIMGTTAGALVGSTVGGLIGGIAGATLTITPPIMLGAAIFNGIRRVVRR